MNQTNPIPRLMVIAERGYCDSDSHWLEQVHSIASILPEHPSLALQIRNKYHADAWNSVEMHLCSWIEQSPHQCYLNGWSFNQIECNRHIPELDMRTIPRTQRTIGASAHSIQALTKATQFQFHYVQYGAIFTTSKPVVPIGIQKLQLFCKQSTLPVLAVGGISNRSRIHRCLSAGAHGVSIGSWIMQAEHPAETIIEILEEIKATMP